MNFLFRVAFAVCLAFAIPALAEDSPLCSASGLKCLKAHFSEMEDSDRFNAILDQASTEAAECKSVKPMRAFLTLVDFNANESTKKNLAAYMGNLCADSAPCFKKASRSLSESERDKLQDLLEDSPSFSNDSEALVKAKCLSLRAR